MVGQFYDAVKLSENLASMVTRRAPDEDRSDSVGSTKRQRLQLSATHLRATCAAQSRPRCAHAIVHNVDTPQVMAPDNADEAPLRRGRVAPFIRFSVQ
jgi:hypothetical protein